MVLVPQNATIRKKESGGVRFQYWGDELELGFEGSRLHCLWARGGPPSGMSQAEGSHVDLCLADGVTRFASRGCFRAAEGRPGPERTDRAVPTISASHAEQTDRQTDDPASLPFLCVYLEMVQVTLMHLPGIFIKLPFSLWRVLSRPLGGAWKSLSDS